MADIRGKQDAGDVGAVSLEFGDRNEGGDIADGDEAPDVHAAMHAVANGSAKQRAVGGYGDGCYGFVFLGHELVTAFVLA